MRLRRTAFEIPLVFGGLLLLAIVRWWPELTGRAAFTAEDFPVLNLPVRAYLGDWLRRGVLVLWTPLLQGGYPLFAESQAGATYPLRFLHALPIAPWTVLAWTIVGHLAWAGAGVYGWLRALGARPVAALLPAVAYACSAHLLVRHQHTNVLEALAWWPWLMAAVTCAVRREGAAGVVGVALAAGLLAMGGHLQFVVYGWTLGLAWGLCEAVDAPDRRRALGRLVAGYALAAGLAAAQALPLAELAQRSLRAEGVWEEGRAQLKPAHLPLLVAPGFWGPLFDSRFGRPAQRWESLAYVGVLPLLLASGALRRDADRRTGFWLGAGALALLASLGEASPVHRLLCLLPGWGSFRAPARLLAVTALATVVLAGLGAERVLAGQATRTRRPLGAAALAALAAVVLPLAVARVAPAATGACRASLALLAALLVAGWWWAGWAPRVNARLAAVGGVLLVVVDAGLVGAPLTPATAPPPYAAPLAPGGRVAVGSTRDPRLFWYRPQTNLLAGLPSIYNMSPLTLRAPIELLERAEALGGGARERLWSLQGVAWVDGTRRGHALLPAPLPPAPPAWSVAVLEVLGDRVVACERVLAADRRPDLEAVVSRPLPPPTVRAALTLVREEPNRAVYEVDLPAAGPAVGVLNTTPYPGRVARLDGRPVPAVAANLLHTAVALSGAGRHHLVLAYESTTVRVGRFVSLLALSLLAAVAVGGRRHG